MSIHTYTSQDNFIFMKSLICSLEANAKLTGILLGVREQDQLMENLHSSFEYISRTPGRKNYRFPLKIDSFKIVLELEIHPTAILIGDICLLDECC